MVVLILALFVVLPLVFMSMLVLFRSKHNYTNKIFGIFIALLCVWIISNFIGANYKAHSISSYFIYADLLIGPWLAVMLYQFVVSYIANKPTTIKSKILNLSTAIGALIADVIVLAGLAVNIEYINGENAIEYFVLFEVYGVLILLILLLTIGLLIRHSRSSIALEQRHAKSLLKAFSVAILGVIAANIILPLLTDSTEVNLAAGNLSYATLVAFTIMLYVNIVRHKLFDIRLIVARAISYVLSLGVVVFALGYLLITAIDKLFLDSILGFFDYTLLLIVIMTVSGLYIPALKFFNRLSNRLFYQDAYDGEELIDNLNRTLVNSVDFEELLTKSALIIQDHIKTTFCTFFIRSTSYFPNRIIGAHSSDPSNEDAEKIQDLASLTKRKVIYVESDLDSEHDKELAKLMKKSDIDILVRLVSTVDLEVKGIGYIFMGPKKSGSLYTKQDLKVLEIIANDLVIAVENVLRFEEIEQFNVTLQKKIDDATKKLKLNNEKLKALDEAKDEFVSMASHQLRTPLTSIKGYISMIMEGDAGKINKPQEKMLGQAYFSSQRMVYLISDLLNVSRLRTGKFIIESKPVFLPDVVETEIAQLHEGAAAKNLTLAFNKPRTFPMMKLDEMKIRQVIMNFVDNAIYYTPSKGKITVSLIETSKAIEFRVKDSGIGVPKAEMHKLFTKFYRAENARKVRPDGTGLGLFMAKKVIIAQGGSIIFESADHRGSTFGFTFPKDKLEIKEKDEADDKETGKPKDEKKT